MPVYIVPYDQASHRHFFSTDAVHHVFRLIDDEFPALPTPTPTENKTKPAVAEDVVVGNSEEFNLVAAEEASPGPIDNVEELPPKPTEFHRFLDLPKEVRESIWDHAIRNKVYPIGAYQRYSTDTVELRTYNTTDSKVFPFLPAICQISRATREESIHVHLRGSTFMVSSYKDNLYITAFLEAHDGYRSIRCLHFENFDWFNSGRYEDATTNADLELTVRCTGLQHIKLRMHNRRLQYHVDPYEDDEEPLPVPVEDLWDHYMMHRLIACEKVVKVTILLKGRCSDASEESAAMLVVKIKEEFLITGRSVAAEAMFG